MKIPRLLGCLALVAATPALAGTITTTFVAGNGAGGNVFDVDVLGSALTVEVLSLNINSGATVDVSVYAKSGTWVGSENNAGAWTLVSQNNGVTSAGDNLPTPVDVTDFTLAGSSTSALYILLTSNDIRYSNSVDHSVFVSNADIAIHSGAGLLAGAAFAVGIFDNRTWNGTIQYSLLAVPEPGTSALFAFGVVGLGGAMIRRRRRRRAS